MKLKLLNELFGTMYLRLLKSSSIKKSVVGELLHGGINCNCRVAVLPVAGKVLVDYVILQRAYPFNPFYIS